MEVNLTPDQKTFVYQAIESGRLHREEEAVQECSFLVGGMGAQAGGIPGGPRGREDAEQQASR